jgi:predicted dehydrogenase
MTTKARIAVIGTGWWSTYTHIPALLANPAAELVALCDADDQRLRAAAQAYGVARIYADHQTMLANEALDGIVIATPHATHFQLAKDSLAHGKHVLVEKPMVLYATDAQELVDLAAQHGRELIIGYPWHYGPHARRARELIHSGELGAVQYVNCTFSSHIIELLRGHDNAGRSDAYPVHGPGAVYSQPHLSGGGMGHLQITHSAGLMFFITQLRARRVHALMRNHDLPLDLVDAITVEFEGGALGTVGGTGNGIQRKLDLQIHCERGCIDMDMVADITVVRYGDGRQEALDPPTEETPSYPRFAPADNLVDIVLGRAENQSPAIIGWRTVELLDAAYRSAKADGQAIAIADLYVNRV